MHKTLISFLIVLVLVCLSAHAESTGSDHGSLNMTWSDDQQHLDVQVATIAPASGAESHVWILTVYGHRFADGIFAFQIHYSAAMDSVLVLPNDFLTARNFTTEQLGIETELSDDGSQLSLRLPILGAIPRLIAEGDLVEVHALWVQQEPLLSAYVPAPGVSAALLPAGGGATVPGSSIKPTSTSPLPDPRSFVQGQSIDHQFSLGDVTALGDGLQRIVLSYTLMRLHDDRTSDFVRFAHIAYDFDTSLYSYSIDTANLAPGRYSLIIGSSNSSVSTRAELEITAPTE